MHLKPKETYSTKSLLGFDPLLYSLIVGLPQSDLLFFSLLSFWLEVVARMLEALWKFNISNIE